MMNNVWKSSQYSTKTKLRLYQSCLISTLLYGSECWRMTESDLNKLSTFHTKNLRRILRIFWPETISNQELLARCNQDSMGTIIMRRRWKWIGHVMRREQDNISRTAPHWTPEGRRRRGRTKITWRRIEEAELKTLHHTWGTIQRLARDRQEWLNFVAALHAKPAYGHKREEEKFEERSRNVQQVKLHKQVAPGQAPNCYRRKGESKMRTTATRGEPGDIRRKQENVIY